MFPHVEEAVPNQIFFKAMLLVYADFLNSHKI